MKTLLLTSGPRGGGKTTLVKAIKKDNPSIPVVSRDEIRLKLFGSIGLNPYTNDSEVAFLAMSKALKSSLSREEPSELVILDCWNGFSGERKQIIKTARECGADRVHCLQFFVPLDVCLKWFTQKTYTGGLSESSVRWDYGLYYKTAEDIEKDGFDSIIPINPCQLALEGIPYF